MSEALRARLDYKAPRPTFIDDAEGEYLVTYSPLDAPAVSSLTVERLDKTLEVMLLAMHEVGVLDIPGADDAESARLAWNAAIREARSRVARVLAALATPEGTEPKP